MKRVFVIFCCLTTISPSADYVVSTFGDDANPGTLAQPFKTIQKAATVMIAGDVCMIRSGTYRETITPSNSGTKTAPLTFKNYADELVIITGLDVVVGWQKDDDTVWKADFNQVVTQVFIDGAPADWARYPNASLTPYDLESWADIETFPDKRGEMSGIAAFGSLR
ncbi:MAG: DUF1565 domain-containing protein, partial [Calditrichaeota bacterium]